MHAARTFRGVLAVALFHRRHVMAALSRFRAYFAIALFLALVPAAPAAEQLDQSNLPEWDGGWTHVNPASDGQAVMWQTFTPACTNLTAVEIDILTISPGRGDDVLTVEIAGDGVVLASAERAVEDGFDGLLRFEFPEAVPLVPEQLYELMVRDTGATRFGWKYGPNTYERGSRYVFAQQQLGYDWFFRTYAAADPPATKYSGGTGEPNDPYQIATASDLIALGETPDDYDKHFILTADIDLSIHGNQDDQNGSSVIGQWFGWGKPDNTPFSGVFDGGGHTISHLTLVSTDHPGVGLFACLGASGEIKNLRLEHCRIDAPESWYVGAVVGYSEGTITNCEIQGQVCGGEVVGGLVGYNDNTVARCHTHSTVSGEWDVGGLVGINSGYVVHSHSTGEVTGDRFVGGLIGSIWGSVSHCFSACTVSGTGYVGGLAGDNDGDNVINCYSSGAVFGGSAVGGLLGGNIGNVVNCYSSRPVSGTEDVGGLVGDNCFGAVIRYSYSTGLVSGSENVGGFVGANRGVVSSSFWAIDTSRQAESAGGVGLMTSEVLTSDIFLDAGWDFLGETQNGYHQVWQMLPGDRFPVLSSFNDYVPPQPKGQGTDADPFLISTIDELATAYHRPTASYRLTGSIDLSGIRWSVAVIPTFAGTFDGAGCAIHGLTITGGSYLGLFGEIIEGAHVYDLGLTQVDVSVTGSALRYAGALAGKNRGNIRCCYSTGVVSGESDVGGLAGGNRGTVSECHSAAVVNGGRSRFSQILPSAIGGLIGDNRWGHVTDSYASGTISGGNYAGGLIGHNKEGRVINCYSTGGVPSRGDAGGLVGHNGDDPWRGTISNAFWDMEASGQTSSDGGTGKTTAEMQMAATFLDAGWDFVGETANGTDDIWWILEGQDYPRLWWELCVDD